ncbi:hypothetical protein HDE_11277 [Halotydeus destructor]|nr:hypothetical protein HDE_11277 [Halotydeus destructor]
MISATTGFILNHIRPSAFRAVNAAGRRFCSTQNEGADVKKPNIRHPDQVVYPRPTDGAYIKYDEEAIEYFTKGIIESQVHLHDKEEIRDEVNPESEPFKQIYVGNEDHGNFTDVEVVDAKYWFWVDRLLPSKEKLMAPKIKGDDVVYPSGWAPPPITAPDRTYFVPRTRNNLCPVYKTILPDEFHEIPKWIGRPRQQPMVMPIPYRKKDPKTFKTLTRITNVDGELRDFERDVREWLEEKHKVKILSACHEGKGTVDFKGNYVEDVVSWLQRNGF